MMEMQSETGRRWITAGLAGAALLSGAYWAEALLMRLREGRQSGATPWAQTQPARAAPATAPTPDLARLLGAPAPAAAPVPSERFKVLGVIAAVSGKGTALMSVDGQPARPYNVGSEIAPGFVLRSVSPREVAVSGANDEARTTLPVPQAASAASAADGSAGPSTSQPATEPTRTGPAEAAGPQPGAGTRSAP